MQSNINPQSAIKNPKSKHSNTPVLQVPLNTAITFYHYYIKDDKPQINVNVWKMHIDVIRDIDRGLATTVAIAVRLATSSKSKRSREARRVDFPLLLVVGTRTMHQRSH